VSGVHRVGHQTGAPCSPVLAVVGGDERFDDRTPVAFVLAAKRHAASSSAAIDARRDA
jgi:hypothetical protein